MSSLSRISFWALFMGFAAYFFGADLLVRLVSFFFVLVYSVTEEGNAGRAPSLQALCSLLLTCFIFVAGFVAGRVARGSEFLNSTATGVIAWLLTLFYLFREPVSSHLYYPYLAALILAIPLAIMGGYFASRINVDLPPPEELEDEG